jgi:hypothetical protein
MRQIEVHDDPSLTDRFPASVSANSRAAKRICFCWLAFLNL